MIRPVVLFSETAAERAKETGESRTSLYRAVERFEQQGMSSLFTPTQKQRKDTHRSLPTAMREVIIELKAEFPFLHLREIATICYVRFGRKPSHHTIQRVLAETAPRPNKHRRYPLWAEMTDPAERRLAAIRLHAEGFHIASIATYLGTSRQTIHTTLKRWIEEGVRGLEDKSHAPKHPKRKITLDSMNEIRKLQENPELGEWRIHAALKDIGIKLSPRTCGRILQLNRQLYGLKGPQKEPHEPKEMPFKASRRHEIWTVDVRYIEDHLLGPDPIYSITIMDNFSRAIISSALSPKQDLTAYLIVLYSAIRLHGAPEALVSDNGSIFKAKQAMRIYELLGIRKEFIKKRQPWMSYIETTFNIQRRMGDFHFKKAKTWEDMRVEHDRWVADYNYQVHWAHRHREDNRHSPAEVLGWVHGKDWTPEQLDRIFYSTRFVRTLNKGGYLRFRHWRLYGELGLAKRKANIWLSKEHLTVEFGDEPLSQYAVRYQSDEKHLRDIVEPRRFETRYRSSQLELWQSGEVEWHLVKRLPDYAPRRKRRVEGDVIQIPFPELDPHHDLVHISDSIFLRRK
ncbi:MAG: helix-turn-helix domain-containing protein [Ktedonobacteraceae bacterium]|nr:helix-turn-helix domain-containing protein [Ktedonobacteraceae bacterium]